jgi:hypothetical protein
MGSNNRKKKGVKKYTPTTKSSKEKSWYKSLLREMASEPTLEQEEGGSLEPTDSCRYDDPSDDTIDRKKRPADRKYQFWRLIEDNVLPILITVITTLLGTGIGVLLYSHSESIVKLSSDSNHMQKNIENLTSDNKGIEEKIIDHTIHIEKNKWINENHEQSLIKLSAEAVLNKKEMIRFEEELSNHTNHTIKKTSSVRGNDGVPKQK